MLKMLLFGVLCALVATASAGYASSSSGSGLYNTNTYGQTYGSKYPYSNSYSGYAHAGNEIPVGPFATPYDFQNQFQQYYNSLSALHAKQRHLTTSYAGEGAAVSAYASLSPSKTRYENKEIKNLFAQQLAYQAALQNSINANIAAIRDQALYGSGYGYGSYPSYGGASAGSGAYASSGSHAGTSGGVGSYGGISPSHGSYGGTYGGPNYASAGGSVGNGYQHQHASIYPANPARPNLDSRFGGNDYQGGGVTHTRGPGGFVGVSSFASSSDINGHKNREAGTSVNNNGKVTTYYTRN